MNAAATPTAARKDCRITRIDTYVVGARWCNWVFAHVFTDDGIAGVGEGTCEFQPQAVVAVIEQLGEPRRTRPVRFPDREALAGVLPQ